MLISPTTRRLGFPGGGSAVNPSDATPPGSVTVTPKRSASMFAGSKFASVKSPPSMGPCVVMSTMPACVHKVVMSAATA
jgi:hypothetical protein